MALVLSYASIKLLMEKVTSQQEELKKLSIFLTYLQKEVATTNNLKDYFFGSKKFGFIIERYDTFNKIM
jgi:hypothetical protein